MLVTITPLITSSKRLCAIKANFHQFSLLLCNVYMPRDSSILSDNNEYIDILNEISVLLNNYDSEYVIVAGDSNTDFSRGNFFL